ncbi:MAG: hypothetical protein UU24_C0039G0010 [Candidatus Nomurabacteria bacterium GW2011_GWA2_40_9]|uniref:OB domain-containing protein n=1 Tax=Candidatus Nomurabacteria bacterium GW2011_GWA2_40_9 TaxID=1618734 RepID=A0A0G0WSM9_9BACT|nr:MAG: hypothetical protein UU24_C0039G0010 [Candidatus Nomurabacteria bacterium GW2011_GWA2_40_9]
MSVPTTKSRLKIIALVVVLLVMTTAGGWGFMNNKVRSTIGRYSLVADVLAVPTSKFGVEGQRGTKFAVNLRLDDGTETIRCVFFRNLVEKLLKLNQEQVLHFKSEPAEFEAAKNELLGTIVKLNGRTNNNSLFNRLEFVVQNVDTSPNPEEEIKRLQG